jgi:hypothetical protein
VPGGAAQLLTPGDTETLRQRFQHLFAFTDEPAAFSDAAKQLQEQIQPIADFLNNAMRQSTELFGRGLIAALEAATESEARSSFLNTLHAGIKDVVFEGLTEAFIASTEFSNLLAPIQQTIRDFTQQAIATGAPPDIGAFRSAILPQIEQISTRSQLLFPLVDVIQTLGEGIRTWLGLIPKTPVQPAPVVPQTITINVSGGDPQQTAREIARLLRGSLPPPV